LKVEKEYNDEKKNFLNETKLRTKNKNNFKLATHWILIFKYTHLTSKYKI